MELRTSQYRAEWTDAQDTQRWLRDEIFIGDVLAFPGGKFEYANVRADIDPSLEPDVVADVRNCPFPRNSFDTVYCDPPFGIWGSGGWINDLWRASRERLVCQTGLEKVTIKGHKPTFYISRPRGPGMNLKVFQVFDRRDERLTP